MIKTAHRKLERDVEISHMMIGNVHESRFSEDVQPTAEVKHGSIKAGVIEQYVVLGPRNIKSELW